MAQDLMRAVAYVRVSKLLEDKLSDKMQENEIKNFCKRHNYKVVKVFTDLDLSGSETEKRTAFNDMFKYIEDKKDTLEKVDAVVCYNLSRFSRSISDTNIYMSRLKEVLECDFLSVKEDYLNTADPELSPFLLSITASFASLERSRLIGIISNSNINRAKLGGRYTNGGLPNYGYSKDGKNVVINETEAEVVRLIFDLYTNKGYSIRGITQYLNRRDDIIVGRTDYDVSKYRKDPFLNELGTEVIWNTSKITRVLKNPSLFGIACTNRRYRTKSRNGNITHKENPPEKWVFSNNFKILNLNEEDFWSSDFEIIQHDFDPIIDLDTFIKAQKKLKLNNKPEPRRISSPYLLSGLLMCACGRRMNGRKDERDSKRTYYYYYCNNAKVSGVCNSKNVSCDIVDRYVFEQLSGSFVIDYIIQLDRKIHEDLKAREQERAERLEEINKLIAANNKKIENFVKSISLTEDLETQKMFIKEIEKLKKGNKTAANSAVEIELEENTELAERERIVKIFKTMNGKLFDSVSFEKKREFFQKFIKRVVYTDKENIDIYIKFTKKTIRKVGGVVVDE